MVTVGQGDHQQPQHIVDWTKMFSKTYVFFCALFKCKLDMCLLKFLFESSRYVCVKTETN